MERRDLIDESSTEHQRNAWVGGDALCFDACCNALRPLEGVHLLAFAALAWATRCLSRHATLFTRVIAGARVDPCAVERGIGTGRAAPRKDRPVPEPYAGRQVAGGVTGRDISPRVFLRSVKRKRVLLATLV